MWKSGQALLASFLFCFVAAAHADVIRLSGSEDGIVRVIQGDDVEITGDDGTIVLQGRAGKVTIWGARHDVTIERVDHLVLEGENLEVTVDQVDSVLLNGRNNDVVVSGSRPRVYYGGENNDLTSSQGTVRLESPTTSSSTQTEEVTTRRKLTLDGSSVTKTMDVDGQDVILNGSDNVVTLTGRPNSVTVNGTRNRVEMESTPVISVTGVDNKIRYRSGQPRVNNEGVGNVITGP